MQFPLINILIRTGFRKELFERCIKSINEQTYPNIRVIVSVDRECDYVDGYEVIKVNPDRSKQYFYDLYCNDLKSKVNAGWFMFLDDDDVLASPTVLAELSLDNLALLVQLDHIGNIVPKSVNFGFGQVGNPCLILHHSLKELAHYTGGDHGDYHYIKEVSEKVPLTFVPLVVVRSDRRGMGV